MNDQFPPLAGSCGRRLGHTGCRTRCWALARRRHRRETLGMSRGRESRVAEFSGTSRGRLRRCGPIHRQK